MKLCAQSVGIPEFSICGDAIDAIGDPSCEEIENFRFASSGERINCTECLRHIADIYENYTPKGRVK